jgi:hypothetical protein
VFSARLSTAQRLVTTHLINAAEAPALALHARVHRAGWPRRKYAYTWRARAVGHARENAGMEATEVAHVSSGRMFRTGLTHLLIGAVWSVSPLVGFLSGDEKAAPWVVAAVVVLWPLGVPILLRGLALLQQSVGENGHFRASDAGIELRLGAPSLYANLMRRIPHFRVLPANPDTFAIRFPEHGVRLDRGGYVYAFAWKEIAAFEVTMFALIVEMHSGARLLLRRFYFVEPPVWIARRLAEITQVLRTAPPQPGG